MHLINWDRDISVCITADLVGRDWNKEWYGEGSIFQQPSEGMVDRFNKQRPGVT